MATTGIRAWLEAQDLGEYVEAFESEKIAVGDLTELTEDDLQGLGLPLGPRRRLLKALRDPAPAAPAELPREAERRQITVMFCDLVGSTALSEKLDPEDLRALMQDYQQAAGGVIERYGGHVAQYLGDGLMTYFGWPSAHEDDAERAVRASLDIVEAVGAMDLAVRIGIATGPVVVGDTGAGDASVPKLAVGETPNLAARLQGLAGPDQIVIGHASRRLLGRVFELDSMGDHELKGIPNPVPVWRVVSTAATEGRFEARTHHLTPFVGRDAEMAMVVSRWEQAKAGEGQVILLSGEPGIGKSRITQQVLEHIADEPHMRLRYQCSPYHVNSALYPIIEQLERAAGFQRNDGADQKLDKLEHLFPHDGADRALIASLMSLPVERYPGTAMSPQRQKDETLRLLVDQALSLAAEAPVLIIFEDVHWIDPTSRELLDLQVSNLARHPVLAVITFRPEYRAPWIGQGHVMALVLQHLSRVNAESLVKRVSGDALDRSVLERIVARADGVPLFVEELTRTVVEGDGNVPETLQDSLMARLDGLGEAKEIAQIGACIGRMFPVALITAVSAQSSKGLQRVLLSLTESGLATQHVQGEDEYYIFKHALIQDVAYGSILRERRRTLHAKIADAILALDPDANNQSSGLLAEHYKKSHTPARAVPLFLEAGRASAAQAALAEAVEYFEAGLDIISAEESGEWDAIELEYLISLAPLGSYLVGRNLESGLRLFHRASEMCEKVGTPGNKLDIELGRAMFEAIGGDATATYERSRALLLEAKVEGEPERVVAATAICAMIGLQVGDFEEARGLAEQTLRLFDPVKHRAMVLRYGMGPLSNAYAAKAWSSWLLGYPDKALAAIDESVASAEEYAFPHDLMLVLVHVGCDIAQLCGRAADVRDYAQRAIALADNIGDPVRAAAARFANGWADFVLSDRLEGRRKMTEAFTEYKSTDVVVRVAGQLAMLAEAYGATGEPDVGLRIVDEEEAGRRLRYPELYRVRGELLCQLSNTEEAETEFRKALELARGDSARSFELRAATSLARLWQSQGKVQEARDLLSPLYGWFTEGFDTPDLQDAKALLDALA